MEYLTKFAGIKSKLFLKVGYNKNELPKLF